MLVVLIATGAIVKDYVLGSVLFAVVVLLSFAIGARKDGGVFLFRLPLSHGHLLGHDDASAERRRSPRLVRPGLPHLHAHLLVRGGLRDHYQDWRPHGRPLRDEAAEGGCRSAGDSGAVLSDAQGGVFCRSGRDEGEGLALSLKNLVSKPALMFESVVVPRDARCAKIADELAAAAVARGIDPAWKEDLLQRAPVRMGRFPASLDPCRLLLASCGC